MDQETIQLLQELVNRGELDSLPSDIRPIVDELISRKVLTVQQETPQPQPQPTEDTRTVGEKLGSGVVNVVPSTASHLWEMLKGVTVGLPQTLEAGGRAVLGAPNSEKLQSLLYRNLGIDARPDYQLTPEDWGYQNAQVTDAMIQQIQDAFGSPGALLNTWADDPGAITSGLVAPKVPAGMEMLVRKATQGVANLPGIRNLPQQMAEKSLVMKNVINQDDLAKVAALKLAENIPNSKHGLAKVNTLVKEASDQVGQIIAKYDAQGAKANPMNVYQAIIDHGKKQSKVAGKQNEIMSIYQTLADEFLSEVRTANRQVLGMPLKQAQELKVGTGAELTKYWRQLEKYGDVKAGRETEALSSAWRGLANELNRGRPELAAANTKMHESLMLQGMLENILAKRQKQPWVSSEITMPAIIESATRGAPGTITAIAATKRYLMEPLIDMGARKLHKRKQGKPLVKNDKVKTAGKVSGSMAWLENLLEEETED